MKTVDICRTSVITAAATAPLPELAKLMRRHHVGSVVVVDANDAKRPLGIVALDDLLNAASATLSDVVQAIGTERIVEAAHRA